MDQTKLPGESGPDSVVPTGGDRRQAADRRMIERRAQTHPAALGNVARGSERRTADDRRQVMRRATDAPRLRCQLCGEFLVYLADLSWALPGLYTIDAGRCVPCARDFLRSRANGEYFDVT